MSKRDEQLKSKLRDAQNAFADVIAASRASALVALHTTKADATPFTDIASRLVTATAIQNDLDRVYAVHIDNWFGPRWLGFCGKIAGAAGVRNRTLKRSLNVPPFHPNRVLTARGHHLRADGLYSDAEELSSLHVHQRSDANICNTIRRNTLYAWYSGNTETSKKGVVMIYYATKEATKAWYAVFDGDVEWRLDEHTGITRAEVDDLISSVAERNAT